MTPVLDVSRAQASTSRVADRVLRGAAAFWFVMAVAGQLIFVLYILAFHGRGIVSGDLSAVNHHLPNGFEVGNSTGNTALGAHLLLAALITLSGALQVIPWIRSHFPVLHRWNGRMYVLVAFIMAISGLYLTLSGRKLVGDVSQHVAINLNAVLILFCSAMTWTSAVARDFKRHRRWALRLFLVVSGVWFFRVGLMFWLLLNGGPVGFDMQSFTGPALTTLAFGQYLLPLAVLEIYLRIRERGGVAGKFATSTALVVLTLAMGAGIFAATMGMWLPKIYR